MKKIYKFQIIRSLHQSFEYVATLFMKRPLEEINLFLRLAYGYYSIYSQGQIFVSTLPQLGYSDFTTIFISAISLPKILEKRFVNSTRCILYKKVCCPQKQICEMIDSLHRSMCPLGGPLVPLDINLSFQSLIWLLRGLFEDSFVSLGV